MMYGRMMSFDEIRNQRPARRVLRTGLIARCQTQRVQARVFVMRLLPIAFILLLTVAAAVSETNTNPITREVVVHAEKLIGLDFSDAKIDMALPGLKEQLDNFEAMRRFPLSNGVPPALQFNPLPVGFKFETG